MTNPSTRDQIPEILVTGLGWLGGTHRSLAIVLQDVIDRAQQSLDITAYSITGEADEVLAAINDKAAQGVTVRMIIDNLEADQDDEKSKTRKARLRTVLREMMRINPQTLRIWNFPHESNNDGLHAKVLVADRSHAVIGSANLSFRGFQGAHELGVLVHGETARQTSKCIDKLIISNKTTVWS